VVATFHLSFDDIDSLDLNWDIRYGLFYWFELAKEIAKNINPNSGG
jgi:hypothetical protein